MKSIKGVGVKVTNEVAPSIPEGATMTNEPKMATTWEECARHVEAGGVVQLLHTDGKWRVEGVTAINYPERTGTPGDGWYQPRRLMPIEDANPEGMTPGPVVDGRPTWYGSSDDARAAGMTEARGWTSDTWSGIGSWPLDEIVQARYPLPKPKTERVYWWEAVDRTDPSNRVIKWVTKVTGSEPRVYFAGCGWLEVSSPDGTVEVLAEDES